MKRRLKRVLEEKEKEKEKKMTKCFEEKERNGRENGKKLR